MATWRIEKAGILLAAAFLLCAPLAAQMPNSCSVCHAALDPPLGISHERFQQDVHAQKGLSCVDCHGGDASEADPLRSMSRAAGFRGHIDRAKIPALCGHCHSDVAFMRRFNPSLRTDQLAQYRTSVHGKRLAGGDTNVAVCTDCHSVHDIRPASDARSKVHPLNVAGTCARCHADAKHMKSYKVPTDQYAGYRASVHHQALTERGDLSAPTCSTCHGNHGAAPPGVASVEFVCSSCHVFQAQLFDKSPHKAAFESMRLPACVTCHSNHRITAAGDTMVGIGRDSTCLNCHSPQDAGYATAAHIEQHLGRLKLAIARADETLDRAESAGMEVSQAKLDQAQARDALTKARVSVHGFQTSLVESDVKAGLVVAQKTLQVGINALRERDYRRMGLLISLAAIAVVLLGLSLYIREIENRHQSASNEEEI